MGLSRNTVLAAFEQLFAEGYLESRPRSGTYVARNLPDHLLATARQPSEIGRRSGARRLSKRGAQVVGSPPSPLPVLTGRPADERAFTIGLPDLAAFPHAVWARLSNRRLRNRSADLMRYHHPAGYAPLRHAIAAHLGVTRGVRCTADQIITVNGSQQALDFCARMLLDPGDSAWIEEPGYLGARVALLAAGAQLIPVPVDSAGLDVDAGIEQAPVARLAVVTPSHQFPLGHTMTLGRRLALIEWAGRTGAWVVEDDYDAEFRYVGRPTTALQGIDQQGCVIYVGTFSKSLFPGLRLGYLVSPDSLVDAFTAAHLASDMHTQVHPQAVLADFISEGHYERHLRRMRVRYGERQECLLETARRELGGMVDLERSDSGLHLVGWLSPDLDDSLVSQEAASRGIDVWPLSLHCLRPRPKPALLFGYAGLTVREIESGLQRLAVALEHVRGDS